jgi:transposase, IS5 family
MKQQSLALMTYEGMKKCTKCDKFLRKVEQAVHWERLLGLIEPHYLKARKGHQPMGLT